MSPGPGSYSLNNTYTLGSGKGAFIGTSQRINPHKEVNLGPGSYNVQSAFDKNGNQN